MPDHSTSASIQTPNTIAVRRVSNIRNISSEKLWHICLICVTEKPLKTIGILVHRKKTNQWIKCFCSQVQDGNKFFILTLCMRKMCIWAASGPK